MGKKAQDACGQPVVQQQDGARQGQETRGQAAGARAGWWHATGRSGAGGRASMPTHRLQTRTARSPVRPSGTCSAVCRRGAAAALLATGWRVAGHRCRRHRCPEPALPPLAPRPLRRHPRSLQLCGASVEHPRVVLLLPPSPGAGASAPLPGPLAAPALLPGGSCGAVLLLLQAQHRAPARESLLGCGLPGHVGVAGGGKAQLPPLLLECAWLAVGWGCRFLPRCCWSG